MGYKVRKGKGIAYEYFTKIMTNCPCFKAGRKLSPVKGLMLHSVGCPQPKAQAFYNIFSASNYNRASVHAFIDADTGDIWQTLPWNHRGWHCGSGSKGSANNTHIGVEMCEPSGIKYVSGATFQVLDAEGAKKQATTTYNAAVELFAYLCKLYNLDPLADGVVISHKEGHTRGIASNHGDPDHLWRQLGLPYTMDGFRKDVAAKLNVSSTTVPTTETPASNVSVNYTVEINTASLNVRKGPGTNYEIATSVKKGEVYTIIEERANGDTKWGLLKSKVGWISLDYTKKKSTDTTTAQPIVTPTQTSYTVKINTSVLNVRKGPSADTAKVTAVRQGEVYTIIEEKNGWGLLKSKVGWIKLSYTKKV